MNFSFTFSISAKKGSQDFGSNFIDSVDKFEEYCPLKMLSLFMNFPFI